MPRHIETEAFEKDVRKRYCKPCEQDGRDHHGIKCSACEIDDMLGEVADAPTADVQEVKHAHWRKTEYAWSICSNCLSTPKMYFPFNYCPWCGAKMDERGEDDDET